MQKIINYNPVTQANEILETGDKKKASEFIAFYQSLPGVKKNKNLEALKNEIDKERSKLTYKAKEIAKASLGFEHHEDYAGKVGSVMGRVPYISDAQTIISTSRELYKDYDDFKQGKPVDTLHLGLTSVGLASALYGLLPGVGHAADPVKKSTGILSKSVKFMKKKLRTSIIALFQPVFQAIRNTGILEIKYNNINNIKKAVEEKKSQFAEVMGMAKESFKILLPYTKVAVTNWPIAAVAVASSSSVDQLNANIKLASEIDADDAGIIQFGETAALEAGARLQAKGEFSVNALKSAMRYGPEGLALLGKVSPDKLEKTVKKAKMLHVILPVAYGCLILFSILVICKTWFFNNGTLYFCDNAEDKKDNA